MPAEASSLVDRRVLGRKEDGHLRPRGDTWPVACVHMSLEALVASRCSLSLSLVIVQVREEESRRRRVASSLAHGLPSAVYADFVEFVELASC